MNNLHHNFVFTPTGELHGERRTQAQRIQALEDLLADTQAQMQAAKMENARLGAVVTQLENDKREMSQDLDDVENRLTDSYEALGDARADHEEELKATLRDVERLDEELAEANRIMAETECPECGHDIYPPRSK